MCFYFPSHSHSYAILVFYGYTPYGRDSVSPYPPAIHHHYILLRRRRVPFHEKISDTVVETPETQALKPIAALRRCYCSPPVESTFLARRYTCVRFRYVLSSSLLPLLALLVVGTLMIINYYYYYHHHCITFYIYSDLYSLL